MRSKSARWLRRAGAVAAFGVAISSVSAVIEPDASRWQAVNFWRQQQGLPQDSVFNILQTRDGYLWIGTRGGLCRFDGVHFTTFDNRDRSQMTENEVWSLAEGEDGSLWVATYGGGVSRLKDGKFRIYTTADGLVNNFATVLRAAKDGSIWIGTDAGVSQFKNDRFTNYTVHDGLAHDAIRGLFALDDDGSVWVGTNRGVLHKIKDGKIEVITIFDPGVRAEIRAICRDSDGALWIGTFEGAFRMKHGQVTRFTTEDGLPSNRVGRALLGPDGNLWLATEGGLVQRRDERFIVHRVRNDGPAREQVTALCTDHEGSLWVGIGGRGLARFRERLFMSYGVEHGLPWPSVSTVLQDRGGNLWLGTVRGVSVFRNYSITALDARSGLPGDGVAVTALAEDREGTLWVGTEGGLYRSPAADGDPAQRRFTLLNNPEMPRMHPKAIFEASDGALWIATNFEGLVRYQHGKFANFSVKDGLANGAVRGLGEDRDGNLWMGTRIGLYKFRDGKFTLHTTKDGLAGDNIEGLFVDRDGIIWIAARQGLTRLKNGKFTSYTVNEGLFNNYVNSIAEDDHDRLWMSCSRGVFWVAKKDFDAIADGRTKAITSVAYGLEHGLNSTVATAGYQPGGFKTSDGRMWFGMSNGVSVVDPAKLTSNRLPPPVHVEQVSIDGRRIDISSRVEAPPGRGDLAFHYAGLSYVAPEKVRFKYRLDPYESDWVDAVERRTAYYNNIRPGNYTFRVIAANNDGVWNETGASFAFRLEPHFYQTGWFYGLCAASVVATGFGFHRARTRQLRRRQHDLVKTVDERTIELRTLQHELEARVEERTNELLRTNAQLNDEIAERRRAEEALRQSEDRYRRFFEDDLAGAFIATPHGLIVACNPAFARIFGFPTVAEATNSNLSAIFPNPALQAELMNTLEVGQRLQDHEVELRRHDGKPVHVIANIIVARDDRGAVREIKGYVIDTTERKRLEAELRQSQKMEAIGQLAGGIAHDFNNLLTGIISYSDMSLDESGLPERVYSNLTEIRNAGQRAGALTRQLLAFSRRQILQPRVLSLNGLISDTEKLLRRLIGEDVNLMIQLAPNLGFVKADAGQIEQIIMNLAVNARDAMPRGGKLIIQTENADLGDDFARENPTVPPGAYVRLSVTDNGCGMDADVQAHLFEPFFTTKGVGRGTGLGLSTVYGIVKQSNGHIGVKSVVGEGTTFTIFFPRVPERDWPTETNNPFPTELRGGDETILLVEDNELVRTIANQVLRQFGYNVLEAAGADDALRLCAEHAGMIHLVLTDVVMPEMNGQQLAERILAAYPRTKVLFMSGYTQDAIANRGGLSVDAPILDKPFTPPGLLRKIREVLDA